MKNFEACKNLKELLGKATAAIPEIEKKIAAAVQDQPGLDEEAVTALALESRDAKQKEAAALENKQNIGRLQIELEAGKKKISIIEAEIRRLEGPAVADIRVKFKEPFEKAVREFVAAAETASCLERRIHSLRAQADEEVSLIESTPHVVLPALPGLLIELLGDPAYGPLARYKKDCNEQGIDIG